ncbi:hypothetical protein COCON_G00058900 [Conger conger]|uniref:Uncharacterized protein n=1 Tax=Conger conger TaxID=82655 RepID=A0A9Q1I2K2_CONCO|nr:hypothetical protein COCON_G00058900 [Conger conger]
MLEQSASTVSRSPGVNAHAVWGARSLELPGVRGRGSTESTMMASAAEEICPSSPNSENGVTTVHFKITRKNQDRPWKVRFIYLQCYFISIATILGTGILGLPVTVAHAGLLPFLVSFLIGFFMQGLLIYLFVDLLQRCRVSQVTSRKCSVTERIVMQDVGAVEPAVTQTEVPEERIGGCRKMYGAVEHSCHSNRGPGLEGWRLEGGGGGWRWKILVETSRERWTLSVTQALSHRNDSAPRADCVLSGT